MPDNNLPPEIAQMMEIIEMKEDMVIGDMFAKIDQEDAQNRERETRSREWQAAVLDRLDMILAEMRGDHG